MLVTGRFGLKSYDLSDPAKPKLLDEITAEQLRLPGDPPYSAANPQSTFWQNEDMDVDKKRKLALLSRDPRAYRGSTTREPGEPDPNGATNIAGVYVVDAKNPADLKLLNFTQLPTGHTTTCINDCEWLWTGGPASTTTQRDSLGWTFGRPLIVTDLRNPASRRPTRSSRSTSSARTASPPTRTTSTSTTPGSPGSPVSAARAATGRRASTTTRSSARSGTRRRWTRSRTRAAGSTTPRSAPTPAAGCTTRGARSADNAPRTDLRYVKGELLLGTEEDFGPGADQCKDRGKFTISSLKGSYNGEGWRSTPAAAVPDEARRLLEPVPSRRARSAPSAPARRTTSTSTARS